MSVPFNPQLELVQVAVEVTGPLGTAVLQLALDTGATDTLVNIAPLLALGYDPTLASQRVQIITGSGVVVVPWITLQRITALGQDRLDFPVLCHTLPPGVEVDGLLGLDFMRGCILTVDFKNGQVALA
jgi:predicted aspartyl protease